MLITGIAIALALAIAGVAGDLPRRHSPPGVLIVVDSRGQRVQLPSPIRRAAVLFPPAVDDYLLVSRRPDTLAIAQALNRRPLTTGLLGRLFPSVGSAITYLPPGAGAATNVEALLLSGSDVVFANLGAAAAFDRAGLPTLAIRNTQDLRYASETDRLYAQANGDFARQPALLAAYRASMADLAATTPGAPSPRVLVLYNYNGATWGFGGHTLLATLLAAAGLRDALGGAPVQRLDHERLLVVDPDMIVIMPTTPPSISPAALMAHPAWASLRAVRARRVYAAMPALEFFPSGLIGYPLFARWLSEVSRPGPARLRAVMRAAYVREAKYRLSDDDLDAALAMPLNRTSAGYARFGRR